MKKTIILILSSLNLMCTAQTKQIETLFEQQNINVLLEEDKDSKTYLNQVAIYTPVNLEVFWGSEMNEDEFQARKIEFSMVFYYNEKSEKSKIEIVSVAHFSKDTTNYKIFQSTFLNNWAWRESKNHFWQPMSFEASKGEYAYIGNSDKKELLPVKVWEYVQKEVAKDSNNKMHGRLTSLIMAQLH